MTSLGTTRHKALIVSLLVLASGYWAWNAYSNENTFDRAPGTLVLSIASTTDTPDATAVLLTVQRVELRTATDDHVILMTNAKTFNTVGLKARWQSTPLTIADIPAGTYGQLRLLVSRVQISTNDGTLKQAQMPANEIIINEPIDITSKGTTSVTLNFLTNKSIHTTKTKEAAYIFAPVIEMTTTMTRGGTTTVLHMGMDINGEMKNDFQLPTDISLQLKHGVITKRK